MRRLYAYLFPFRGQTGYRGRAEYWLWVNSPAYREYWGAQMHGDLHLRVSFPD